MEDSSGLHSAFPIVRVPAFVGNGRNENGVFANEIGNVEWKDREIDPPEASVPLAPEDRVFQDGLTDFPDFVLEAISEARLLALVIIDRCLLLSERIIDKFKFHLAKRLSIFEKTISAGMPWDSPAS